MVKNCDLGLENAALGLRPRAVFSTIRTSQQANNIYIYGLNLGLSANKKNKMRLC